MGKRKGKEKGELLPGTLDMLILKTLSHRAQHGYGIAQQIQKTSGEELQIEEGSALSGSTVPATASRRIGKTRANTEIAERTQGHR